MRSSFMAVSNDAQQSPAYTLGESAITGSTASPSASIAEDSGNEEARLNGSKKRKRSLKISCELCKSRKVKCDRVEPSCGWCARHSRVCVYEERKKPGLRVGYGRELEDKINRLEAILQVLGRRVEDHISEHEHMEGGSPRPGFQSPESALNPRASRLTNSNDGGQQNLTSEPRWEDVPTEQMQYSRPPDTMSIQSVVQDPPLREEFRRPELPSGSNENSNLFQIYPPAEPDLPPADLLYSIVDLYFMHIGTWSPIIDRQATLDALFGSSTLTEPDRILAYAIVATTLRFSKDSRLTPQSRQQYHDLSKQKVELYGFENLSVRAMQALVILSLDVLGTSNGSQGSSLLALIARNLVHLGLDVERGIFLELPVCPSIGTSQAFILPQPTSWIEEEERRRLFWMVYVLDRYATIASGFDFTLDERCMDRSLPCRYDLFSENQPVETKWFRWPEGSETLVNRPENLGSFSYHCEVLRILSRIHRFLKRPVDIGSSGDVERWRQTYRELGGELDSWLQNLPGEYGKISQLCHSDPASKISNWIMLHAAFVTSVIRLHSSAAYPTIRSHLFTPSYNAMQKCLSAVESLREIAQDVLNTGMLDLLGPPFAFSLWVSARLLLVHAATTETEVDPKIRFFITTLEQMGQFWEVAQNYAKILDHVVREHQQSESPEMAAENGNSGSVRTFTAMRRCAYDLNLLISQRPRTVLNPASRSPSLKELEYLEIFDFFNYPRLRTAVASSPRVSASLPLQELLPVNGFRATNFAMPTPESDWLIFRPPCD